MYTADAAPSAAGARRDRRGLAWAVPLLALGALLRLHQFALGRTLYVDEAALALNLLERSYAGLWTPLAYDQAAPIGFLLLEKFALGQLGDSEYALRLLPLLAGLTALALFARLAARTLPALGAAVALAGFALSAGLIYFSADLKPYSLDVALALTVLLAARPVMAHGAAGRPLATLALVGAAAVWFSYPALFVVAGVGLTLGLDALFAGRRAALLRLGAVAGVWLASFGLMYFASLHDSSTVTDMQFFWARDGHFMPLPPVRPGDLLWFEAAFFGLFRQPTGLPLAGLAGLLFLLGAVRLWKGERLWLAMLLAPLLLTLLASGFQLYPFRGRVLLFLTPAVLLLIGAGVAGLGEWLGRGRLWAPRLAAGLLLLHPALTAAGHLLGSDTYAVMPLRDLRGVLQRVQTDPAASAPIYVYYGADRVFEYYGPRLGFAPERVHWGRSPGRKGTYTAAALERLFREELPRLAAYEQVWLVFANGRRTEGVDEEALLLRLLERETGARPVRSHRARGAVAHLYARAPGTLTRR